MRPAAGLVVLFAIWAAVYVLVAIPAYQIGKRRNVVHSAEAFLPFVGPYIVLLHSVRRSGWLSVLGLIPYVGFVFFIWLSCVIPIDHRRTKWWILPFLIPGVNFVAYYFYAFTLRGEDAVASRAPAIA